MRILLARHGETPWNAEGRYQGQIDIPLSPVGEAQARALGERLREATTLHRLLGARPDTRALRHDARHPEHRHDQRADPRFDARPSFGGDRAPAWRNERSNDRGGFGGGARRDGDGYGRKGGFGDNARSGGNWGGGARAEAPARSGDWGRKGPVGAKAGGGGGKPFVPHDARKRPAR